MRIEFAYVEIRLVAIAFLRKVEAWKLERHSHFFLTTGFVFGREC